MKNFSVKFKVINDDAVEEVFSTFKIYQQLNLIDKKARIIYKDVIIPAGYIDTYEEFRSLYQGILDGSFTEMIGSISPSLERADIEDFLNQCNMERLKQFNSYLHKDKIDKMIEKYMMNQKVMKKEK